MTPYTGKQIITIHILPNISKSKGNQTMKFGQLKHDVKKSILGNHAYIAVEDPSA